MSEQRHIQQLSDLLRARAKQNGRDTVYPVVDQEQTPNGTAQIGLTKREYFAALAMQALCARPDYNIDLDVKVIAGDAVKMADALLMALVEEGRSDG